MGTHGEKTAEENKAWLARTLKSGQISIAGIFFYRFETVEKNSGNRNLAWL